MPSRLSDIEAQQREEKREARRWRQRNAHRLPSQEPPRERSVVSSGDDRVEHARVLFGGALLEVGEEVGVVYSERNRFVPLQGFDRPIDLDSAATSARVDRAMRSLPVKQQDLLNAHYLMGKTLAQLSRRGESRQAVHGRVKRASEALLRAIIDQADDPLVLTVEDF